MNYNQKTSASWAPDDSYRTGWRFLRWLHSSCTRCLHGSLCHTSSVTSHQSASSSEALISVHPSNTCFLCIVRRPQQLVLGLLPSTLLRYGTVSRSIIYTPGPTLWLPDVDTRLINSIVLVIFPLSYPSHLTGIAALYLFVNCYRLLWKISNAYLDNNNYWIFANFWWYK